MEMSAHQDCLEMEATCSLTLTRNKVQPKVDMKKLHTFITCQQ